VTRADADVALAERRIVRLQSQLDASEVDRQRCERELREVVSARDAAVDEANRLKNQVICVVLHMFFRLF